MNPRQFRSLVLFSYFLSILFIGFQSQPLSEGHSQVIMDAAFSPDGRFIVTTSIDKSLVIWDAAQCKAVRTISGLEAIITQLDYSPDGLTIASGDAQGNIKLWDANTGALLNTLRGHSGVITSLDYNPDGTMLVSTSFNNVTATVWDMENKTVIRRLNMNVDPNHELRTKSAVFSPDGQFIAAANGEEIDIWNASTGAYLNRFVKPMHFANRISFSPDGQTLITSGDGEVAAVLWDASTGRELSFLSDEYLFRKVEGYSPDGHYLLSRYNNWLEVWNAWTLEWVADLGENRYALTSANYSPNGRYIVSSSLDTQAIIWDANTLEVICRLGESRG